MERRAPADNNAPHFLDMMVHALRAVDLVAKSDRRYNRPHYLRYS
jgi:hypothetical protein